jgi:hypothetical protein
MKTLGGSATALLVAGSLLGGALSGPIPAQQPPGAATADGLVGYWAFDEGEGTSAANSVRSGADLFGRTGAASILAPVWVGGRHGRALEFTGGATAVLVEKTAQLECDDQVTIAAWVKLGEPDGRGLIVNHEYAYRLCVNQGGKRRVRLQLNLDGEWAQNWLVGSTSLEPGEWYYVAGVYDGHERRIYVDGQLDGAEPAQGNISAGRQFAIGAQSVDYGSKRVYTLDEAAEYTVANPFPGVIDEVRIWKRALSESELRQAANQDRATVLALLPKESDLYFHAVQCVAMAGEESELRIAVFNGGAEPYAGALSVAVTDPGGVVVDEARLQIDIASSDLTTLGIPFRPEGMGAHTVSVSSAGRRLFEMPVGVLEPVARAPVGQPTLRPALSVDLTQKLGANALCDDGTSRVVQSKIGSYREAGEQRFSRFVVRLPLRRTGLHLVRVTYPDDRARTCEIASWSPVSADRFNAHTGYFTGDKLPISGRFQVFEFVMWARSREQALVFTTWLEDRPAAASAIDVFEIEGRLPARPASRGPSRRLIGHYWEDAQPLSRCFGGNAPELMDFDKVVREMCDYFDYTGQNLLMHPVVWYEGPIYNSLVESRGGAGGFHLPTAGWIDILLRRFEERGFKFYGLLNVHQLPSLMAAMNADSTQIRAGVPTFNTVSKDNEASAKTWHHRSAMFNALHPRVQEPVIALVAELADRYSDSPAFGGLGFHLTIAQLLQPGSLDVSYDDWTVAEFTNDTGIDLPVAMEDPERFGKRHEWLMANARDEWVRWRCERTADYFGRVAETLRARRADLQLVVTILEPPMSIIDPQRLAWLGGQRLVEMSREAGIDPDLLAKHPGVVIQQRLGPTARMKRLTFGVTKGRWGTPPPTLESIDAIRSMDLDSGQQKQFRTTTDFGVFLYNRYFESDIGRTRPLDCEWYESIPWRASAVVATHDHFMEYYAKAMAIFDPTFIAIGGFTNGTVGHETRVERFTRVYRQLPVGEWHEIPNLPADIVGRTIEADGNQYIYLVNQSSKSQRVLLQAAEPMKPLSGSPPLTAAEEGLSVELGPYQLAGWVRP